MNFEEDAEAITDTNESDSSNNRNHSIKYSKWVAVNGKSRKVMVSLPFSDVLEILKKKINELKYHFFCQKWTVQKSITIWSFKCPRMQSFCTLTTPKNMRTSNKLTASQCTLDTHHSLFSRLLLILDWMRKRRR